MTDYQTPERMALKQQAIPFPILKDKTVLDVGCDHGHWCWFAVHGGAKRVVGIDRNRSVRGEHTDLIALNQSVAQTNGMPCEFRKMDLGRQWCDLGAFDVVFCFSMYHHIFANCCDHNAIWFWLWRHTVHELLWENPTGPEDSVVAQHVKDVYCRPDIMAAAQRYFVVEKIGPALHVPTREVWRCAPLPAQVATYYGKPVDGAGGASKAFEYAGGRRIHELEAALGIRVLPGSLNVRLTVPFDWNKNYVRVKILDVVDRKAGLDSAWEPRWCRFYPVDVNGVPAAAMRFEGERYPDTLLELVSDVRLRDRVGDTVTVLS